MSDDLASIQERTFERSRPSTRTSFAPATRLTAEQLCTYLDRRVFAVVATTRPDGRPHAAMTSYFRQGSVFWLPTVADAVRCANVLGQPWVSLVVAEGDRDAHVMVTIEGTADVVAPVEVPESVRELVDGDWVVRWIRVTARRVLSYGAPGALPSR